MLFHKRIIGYGYWPDIPSCCPWFFPSCVLSSSSPMDYDIFREELKYPAFGHPLWDPSSGGLYNSVEVGDVGFIRDGKFHRLFNILLPADDPSHENFGVPEYHQPLPLQMGRHTYSGLLSPNDFCSKEVTVGIENDILSAKDPPEPGQVRYSCLKRGAILSLPVPAEREDTIARGEFAKCIVKHIDTWFAFARNLGLGVKRMEDIVLVTGRHLGRSWTNVVFSESQAVGQVSLKVKVSGISDVEWQFSREDVRGVVFNRGPSGKDLPMDQCIFVRGFRVTRILKILPRIRGAAEPAQSPGEDEPEFDKYWQLVSIPLDTNCQDPLHTILDYLAEKAPECDMALVHDDDLICVDGVPLENCEPYPLRGHLWNFPPEIWQVERTSHDSFSDCGSGLAGEGPIVKVATLFKHTLAEKHGFESENALTANKQLTEYCLSPHTHPMEIELRDIGFDADVYDIYEAVALILRRLYLYDSKDRRNAGKGSYFEVAPGVSPDGRIHNRTAMLGVPIHVGKRLFRWYWESSENNIVVKHHPVRLFDVHRGVPPEVDYDLELASYIVPGRAKLQKQIKQSEGQPIQLQFQVAKFQFGVWYTQPDSTRKFSVEYERKGAIYLYLVNAHDLICIDIRQQEIEQINYRILVRFSTIRKLGKWYDTQEQVCELFCYHRPVLLMVDHNRQSSYLSYTPLLSSRKQAIILAFLKAAS
ncbi:hypothetical protein BGW80DRAFT_78204 [Lactifluus volemus]|nr:hypothetical protein BGW80DRAFT_78204 [Lactifluus volemus]